MSNINDTGVNDRNIQNNINDINNYYTNNIRQRGITPNNNNINYNNNNMLNSSTNKLNHFRSANNKNVIPSNFNVDINNYNTIKSWDNINYKPITCRNPNNNNPTLNSLNNNMQNIPNMQSMQSTRNNNNNNFHNFSNDKIYTMAQMFKLMGIMNLGKMLFTPQNKPSVTVNNVNKNYILRQKSVSQFDITISFMLNQGQII